MAQLLRATLTFFSTLAVGILTAGALVALMPSIGTDADVATAGQSGGLHFESVLLGVLFGLVLGTVARYNWADVPRRVITWFLIRERQFFYYFLIAICIGVLLFY